MRSETRLPEGKDLMVPVSVPSESGKSELVVGKGSLKGGQLVVKFNEKVHAVAVQRALSRGSILGIQFVMYIPDNDNMDAQVRLDAEAEEQAAVETIEEENTEEKNDGN